jgi:Ni,Fe-hydrogenase maturation factor
MSVVVFAVGNPSRGDDALGPLLMAGLEQARPASGW